MRDFGGLGRLARKTEIVKNERCTIRYSPSNGPWQALHDTHRQIPQRHDLHTVAGGAKPVPFIKLNSTLVAPVVSALLSLAINLKLPVAIALKSAVQNVGEWERELERFLRPDWPRAKSAVLCSSRGPTLLERRTHRGSCPCPPWWRRSFYLLCCRAWRWGMVNSNTNGMPIRYSDILWLVCLTLWRSTAAD